MKFVMEIERMEFSEALRFLADKAGVVLERQDPKLLTLKNKVIEVLKQTDRFYRFQLTKNKQAQDYLFERGLKPETINFFGLGFAPQGWQNLFNYLKKLGFGDNEIEQAGVIIKRAYSAHSITTQGGERSRTTSFPRQDSGQAGQASQQTDGYYDRFRSRIMFPIFDATNRVIGFSGRILPPDGNQAKSQESVEEALRQAQGEAKYINTPETVVYQKGKVLYGFSHTQSEIRAKEQAVLVEGNLDVLMGWQEGLKNIVAASGTGLTEFQLRNLSRFCKSLVLSFDMDKAGEQATDRSIGLASQMGFDLSVLSLPTGQAGLPEGKDMADFAKTFSGRVSGLLEQTKSAMQYYFDKVFSGEDQDSVQQKKKAVAYLLPRIKFLKNPVEQNDWLAKLSSQIKVPEKMIFEEFGKTKSLLETGFDRDENQATAGSAIFIKSRQERLAEKILGLAARFPELAPGLKDFLELFPYRLKEAALFLSRPERQTEEASQTMDQEVLNYLYLLGDYETSLLSEKFSPQQEFEKSLFELKKVSMKSKVFDMAMAMKEADQMGNKERSAMLAKEMKTVLSELGEFENNEQNL